LRLLMTVTIRRRVIARDDNRDGARGVIMVTDKMWRFIVDQSIGTAHRTAGELADKSFWYVENTADRNL
jgi:hypothetical protein